MQKALQLKALVRQFRFALLRVECVRDRRVNVPWFNFSQR